MREIWKPIYGFEDRYLISNNGNVFSIVKQRNRTISEGKRGYRIVTLKNVTGNEYE